MAIEGIKSHYNENIMRYYVATEEQIELILNGAFEILEEVGTDIMDPKARDYMEKYGCRVEGNRVYIDRELVKQALPLISKFTTVSANPPWMWAATTHILATVPQTPSIMTLKHMKDGKPERATLPTAQDFPTLCLTSTSSCP